MKYSDKSVSHPSVFTVKDWVNLLGRSGATLNKRLDYFRNSATEYECKVILIEILKKESLLRTALKLLTEVPRLRQVDWYINDTLLCGTIWNALLCRPLDYGIEYLDLTYWDEENLSRADEQEVTDTVSMLSGELKKVRKSPLFIKVKAVNAARSLVWHTEYFSMVHRLHNSPQGVLDLIPYTNMSVGVGRSKGERTGEEPYTRDEMLLGNDWRVYNTGLTHIFSMICKVRENEIVKYRDTYLTVKMSIWLHICNTLEFDFSVLATGDREKQEALLERERASRQKVRAIWPDGSKFNPFNVSIRKARTADIEAANQLFNAYLEREGEYSYDSVAENLEHLFVAVQEDIVIGAVMLCKNTLREWEKRFPYEIGAIAVMRTRRGGNVAAMLIKEATKGVTEGIQCQAWATGENARLANALAQTGFELHEIVKDYWKDSEICQVCAESDTCRGIGICDAHMYAKEGVK